MVLRYVDAFIAIFQFDRRAYNPRTRGLVSADISENAYRF